MRYLIGEMAKLNKVSTQTLRYYDKIALFSPAYVDEETGYRYYTLSQFQELQTINYLKFIGMSLGAIKDILREKDINQILKQLENQRSEVDKKINELLKVKNNLEFKTNMLSSYLEIEDYSQVWIEEMEPFYVFSRRVDTEFSPEDEFVIEMNKLVDEFFDDLFIYTGDIGITIDKEKIEEGSYVHFKDIFYATNDSSNPKCRLIERGLCVRALHKGSFSKTYETYEKIKKYIKSNGYQMIGDSVELGIVDIMVVDNEEDLLLDISIPVKKI